MYRQTLLAPQVSIHLYRTVILKVVLQNRNLNTFSQIFLFSKRSLHQVTALFTVVTIHYSGHRFDYLSYHLPYITRVTTLFTAVTIHHSGYRSVYRSYQHLLTQEAENSTDHFLRGEHDLPEYQEVGRKGEVG